MADHVNAYRRTRAFEGGNSLDSRDPGNWCGGRLIGTASGLSAQAFKRIAGRCPQDLRELAAVQTARGQNFFKWFYWDAVGGDQLQSQSVAEALADFAYNAGPGGPLSFLRSQGLLLANGRPDAVRINKLDDVRTLDELTNARRAWHMAARNEKGEWLWPHFWQGWERRIAAFSRPGIYPETSENLLRQWRVRWYNNPNGPVDPPRPPADPGAILSTAAWLAVPAIAYFYGPRLLRMARRLIK